MDWAPKLRHSLSTLPLRPGIGGVVSSEESDSLLGSMTVVCVWVHHQPLQDRGVAWFIFAPPVQLSPWNMITAL